MTKAERRKRDDEARELFLSKWSLPDGSKTVYKEEELAEALCPWVGERPSLFPWGTVADARVTDASGAAAGDAAGAVGQQVDVGLSCVLILTRGHGDDNFGTPLQDTAHADDAFSATASTLVRGPRFSSSHCKSHTTSAW